MTRARLGGIVCDLVETRDVFAEFDEGFDGVTGPRWFASANLDKITHFADEPDGPFSGTSDHWFITLDGAPMARVARRLTGRRWPRLSGSDLLPQLLDRAAARSATVAVLGGDDEAHRRLEVVLARQWPKLRLGPCLAPTVEESTDPDWCRAAADKLRDERVDLLIMALSGGRMERWVHQWGELSGVRIALCFGAALDFLIGTQRRAPRLVQRLELEWLWRLAGNPRRLARRYLIEGPPAMWRLLRDHELIEPVNS
jgi:exopolysaccharide biosynthesis WecB/TagA/CpsF family protein